MSTQPKSPRGRPQSNPPQGVTRRKAEQKPRRKVAAEDTGAAKREGIVQTTEAAVQTVARQALTNGQATKDAVKSAMETIERSWKAAGLGTVAVNRKLIDFTRQNVTSGLDLAKRLADAKNPAEMAWLHMVFWDEQMRALASQAAELRALSADLITKASEPIREHVRKSLSDQA